MKQALFTIWFLFIFALALSGGALSTAAQTEHQTYLPLVQTAITSSNTIMPSDEHTLALFALDGNVQDTSGHGRDAVLISGTFTSTLMGQGLQLSGQSDGDGQSFHWNAYADLLVHPYTVEMIVTPEDTQNYRKLFSLDDSLDAGWYYRSQGLTAYPHERLGEGQALPNEQHYLAFVSLDNATIEIYLQGVSIGTTEASFTAPAAQAIFFNDDTGTGRGEQLTGVVEEVRISDVSRTAVEIQAIQTSR